MNIRIDTQWQAIDINVITGSNIKALLIMNSLLELDIEFKVTFVEQSTNDSPDILEMICGR